MLKGKKLVVFNTLCLVVFLLVTSVLCSFALSEEIPKYDREKHFKHWSDLDGNGLDTRQDTLIHQALIIGRMHYVNVDSPSKKGKVVDGVWVCPYTGSVVRDPALVEIDHIVPLKYAWMHGAYSWSNTEREYFANDNENLLVVLDFVNQSKSDSPPEKWLPPNEFYIYTYASKFEHICKKYKLSCDFTAISDIKMRFTDVKKHSSWVH